MLDGTSKARIAVNAQTSCCHTSIKVHICTPGIPKLNQTLHKDDNLRAGKQIINHWTRSHREFTSHSLYMFFVSHLKILKLFLLPNFNENCKTSIKLTRGTPHLILDHDMAYGEITSISGSLRRSQGTQKSRDWVKCFIA